jgi:hypothetical protein
MLSKLRMFVTVAVVAGLISTAGGRNPVAANSPQAGSAQKSDDAKKKPDGEPLSEDRMSTRGLHPPSPKPKNNKSNDTTKKSTNTTKKAAHPPAKPAAKPPAKPAPEESK